MGDRTEALHIAIAHDLTGSNSYMRRLAGSLEAEGCRVTPIGQRTVFLHRFIGRGKPRVVHFHWLHVIVIAAGRPLKTRVKYALFALQLTLLKLLGIGILWTAHDLRDHDQQEPTVDRRATARMARMADAIIVHSGHARTLVSRAFPQADASRIVVIPHGNYDDDYNIGTDRKAARAKLGLRDDQVALLFFGSVRAYKGVTELIEAFKATPGDHLRLIVAGKPLHEEDGEAVRRVSGGDDRIEVTLDFLPADELSEHLAGCDLAVLPYRNILTSGAAVLGMTFGKAIIAPRIGCFTDTVSEEGGYLYDPGDPDGLRGAIERAVRDREGVAERGRRNRAYAAATPWSMVGRRTREVAEAVLGKSWDVVVEEPIDLGVGASVGAGLHGSASR